MVEYSDNAKAIYSRLFYADDEKTPEECHVRVSKFISNNEEEYVQYKFMLDEKIFRPNTPCMANSAAISDNIWDRQLSACHIIRLEDSLESIIDMWKTCARIYASGAGAGIPATNLREKKCEVAGGKGFASGPEEYLYVHDVESKVLKSAGKNRRAANLATLWYKHPDIMNLVDIKN